MNYSYIAAYITFLDLRINKRRRFIPFLVYDMVYPSIASNLVSLGTLIPWLDSV